MRPGTDAPHRPAGPGALAQGGGQCAQRPGRTRPSRAYPDVTARWPADPSHIAQAAAQLRAGAVIAFPTDTLYAVAARATDPAAVARLYEVKQRPSAQPMVWLVLDKTQVERFAVVSAAAGELRARVVPGP